jgi:hypothetical protein
MSRWIDITTDTSKKYYNAFMQKLEMPEYVKSANVTTADDTVNMNSDCFADNVGRRFPINTKASCWCSAVYFYGNQCNKDSRSRQVEANLEKAASIWGISNDLTIIKKAFSEHHIPVTYALSFEFKGKPVNRCPDHTKEAAITSAQWLYENKVNFPLQIQKQAAARLAVKADLSKVSSAVASYIDRLANSESYSNLNCKVAVAITDRLNSISTAKWDSLENEMLKIANELAAKPFELCHSGELLSTALEALDVKHGLNHKWGSALQHPIDCCYKVNVCKVAMDTASIVHLTTGTPVDLAKISDLQLEKGLKIAGDDFLSYCQTDGFNVDRNKAAEILPTLPKPEAKRFEGAIKSAGYIPETTYDLADRLFKESNMMMPGMGQMPQMQPPAQEELQSEDVPQPESWEDDAAFEARMQEKKEEARIATLDAQAGIAAAKARQAKQQRIVNPNGAAQDPAAAAGGQPAPAQ